MRAILTSVCAASLLSSGCATMAEYREPSDDFRNAWMDIPAETCIQARIFAGNSGGAEIQLDQLERVFAESCLCTEPAVLVATEAINDHDSFEVMKGSLGMARTVIVDRYGKLRRLRNWVIRLEETRACERVERVYRRADE